jgi:hypothetical protein
MGWPVIFLWDWDTYGGGFGEGETQMKLYHADRYGMISSTDIAHWLRRGAARKRAEEQERKQREQRRQAWATRRRAVVARARAMIATAHGWRLGLIDAARAIAALQGGGRARARRRSSRLW